MSTEIALFEPIPLPDPRRPATLPSLPAWAARLNGAVRLELQMTPDGKTFEKADVLVLPPDLMPTERQILAMRSHQANLRSYLLDTPAHSVTAETRVATAVSKLLTVLAGERKSDLVEEARSEVYLDVLDDVPCWAVESAVRRWFKHDCGADERGKPYAYQWAPDPGTLRNIAQEDARALGARIGQIQRILDAREFVDCSMQIENGRKAMIGLNETIKSKGLSAASALTFADAIAIAEGSSKKAEAAE